MWLLRLTLCFTLISGSCSYLSVGMKKIWRVSSSSHSNVAQSTTILYDTLPVDFGVLKISGDDRLKVAYQLLLLILM